MIPVYRANAGAVRTPDASRRPLYPLNLAQPRGELVPASRRASTAILNNSSARVSSSPVVASTPTLPMPCNCIEPEGYSPHSQQNQLCRAL
jgi:hypothetical protein